MYDNIHLPINPCPLQTNEPKRAEGGSDLLNPSSSAELLNTNEYNRLPSARHPPPLVVPAVYGTREALGDVQQARIIQIDYKAGYGPRQAHRV